MYKFKKEQVLDAEFLTKLVTRFKGGELKRYIKAEKYYGAQNDIYDRKKGDLKENNKLAHGFARYISNMATAYFVGKPVRYVIEDEIYKEALESVLKANYIDTLNFNVSLEASKKGMGFLLLYINEEAKLRIKKMDAECIIPVFSPSLGEFLECAVMLAEDRDIDGKLLVEHAYVYDKDFIHHYSRDNTAADFAFVDRDYHMLSDVPVICVMNNEEALGDYEPHYALIDAYDRAQSNSADDSDYFSDSYMAIVGAGGGLESALTEDSQEADNSAEAKNLRENKLLLLDEKGQAYFIEKNTNDTANENYKNRVFKDLFFLSQVPALTDENFSGNLTGVAIRYKLTGLEELAIMKENNFRAAQHKMIKIITDYLYMMTNRQYDPETVEQKYERNFVDNDTEIIENVTKLEGIVSKETQLNMLPQKVVDDAQDELEKIRQEAAASEGIPYVRPELITNE